MLIDKDNGQIEWSYFEKLVDYGETNNFNLMHSLQRKHIDWHRNVMKVDIAVQTLSASTADSLEFLMKKGEPGFDNAGPTIRFVRIFNNLFDVFNTKTDNCPQDNIFKRALCSHNHEDIFALFELATDYIKHLRFVDETDQNREKLIIASRVRTGFKGFIIDMHNLIQIYKEYIVNKQLMTSIHVHWLGQDPLEIFFGKCRSLNGYNDNPTAQQFMAAFRKLLAFDAILCSRYSNCTEHTVPSQPSLMKI